MLDRSATAAASEPTTEEPGHDEGDEQPRQEHGQTREDDHEGVQQGLPRLVEPAEEAVVLRLG